MNQKSKDYAKKLKINKVYKQVEDGIQWLLKHLLSLF